ncbi:DHA1 family bicyclomycin/chloramphenicol resistance-like MFS transporter [Duganella sp. 1411]|uniref:multidrug effflux MFS transporter n=1 Tax=Duganella sp. 1411 TaxID=2806572 RepID=UPI001B5CA086|nr:DHA1 family bicyclomycin/chloramphenicol resistance-like MFS transporter [Duganella sp. 1411]
MKSKTEFIFIVSLISTFGLLASDIYVPAMPLMAAFFKVSVWQIQQSIAVYLCVLALAQIVYGPLSDHFGRRRLLLSGIALYVLGGALCAASASFELFLLGRCVQALGAASGLVIGRALISDRYPKHEAAKIYNIVYPLVSLSPALAPAIGGYLTSALSWRWSFIFVALFACVPLLLVALRLPETHTSHGHGKRIAFLSGLSELLGHRTFVLYTMVVCAIYSAWFVYLTQSTFIFHALGLSENQAGWLYIPLTCGIFLGNFISKKLLERIGYDHIVGLGVACFVTGGLVFAATAWLGSASATLVILPMTMVSLANGSSLSLAVSGAVASNPQRAASASGLVGFFQIGSAALSTALVSLLFGTGYAVLAFAILGFALLALAAALFLLNS